MNPLAFSKRGRKSNFQLSTDRTFNKLSEEHVAEVVDRVNGTRVQLARRLSQINLFPEAAEANDAAARPLSTDHPLIQILMQMAKVNRIEAPNWGVKEQMQSLRDMAKLTLQACEEANQASRELFHIKSTQDEMEIKRQAAGGDAPTLAETLAAIVATGEMQDALVNQAAVPAPSNPA